MTLQKKLVLMISVFAALPIACFGIYQGITGYRSEIDKGKQALEVTLSSSQTTFSDFLNNCIGDVELISKMAEVRNLFEGLEMEDMDEITFWTEALSKAMHAFSENRKVFRELRFATADGSVGIGVTYQKGKGFIADAGKWTPLKKHLVALDTNRVEVTWPSQENKNAFWIHYPVGEESAMAIFSASVNLKPVLEICSANALNLFVKGGHSPIQLTADDSSGMRRFDTNEIIKATAASNIVEVPDGLVAWQRFYPTQMLPEKRVLMVTLLCHIS